MEQDIIRQRVVSEGDPAHNHNLVPVKWDETLGPKVGHFDEDSGCALEFPMAMYKRLLRCSCGREVITSQPALI